MSHLIIEIVDTKVDDRSGVKAETGKKWRIATQRAYAHTGEAYPLPFNISIDVENGKGAWQPGKYVLGGGSVRIGQYGLEFTRYPELVPVAAPKQA